MEKRYKYMDILAEISILYKKKSIRYEIQHLVQIA